MGGIPSPGRQAACGGGGLAQGHREMGSATRLDPIPIQPHAVLLTCCPGEQPLPIRKSNWEENQSISGEESPSRIFISPTLRTRTKTASLLLSESKVRLFATPWTAAHQPSPSMGFSRQEYRSRLPFSSPGDLPDPGIEPRSPELQADALPSEPPGALKWEGV